MSTEEPLAAGSLDLVRLAPLEVDLSNEETDDRLALRELSGCEPVPAPLPAPDPV
jgi:hypothetical protein